MKKLITIFMFGCTHFFLFGVAHAFEFSIVDKANPLKSGTIIIGTGFGFQDVSNGGHFVRIPRILMGVGFADVVDLRVDYEYLLLRHDPVHERHNDSGDVLIRSRLAFLNLHDYFCSLGVNVKLPNASDDKGLGTDETDIYVLALISKAYGKVGMDLSAGLGILGDPRKNADQKDVAVVSLSATYPLADKINVKVEFAMNADAHDVRMIGNKFNDEDILKAGGGVEFPLFRGLEGELLAHAGLTNSSPNYEIFLGIRKSFKILPLPIVIHSS